MRSCVVSSLIVVLLGCSTDESPGGRLEQSPAGTTSIEGEEPDSDVEVIDGVPRAWPQLANPVTHDVDADLIAVLEKDALEGACEAYRAGDERRETRLRCGKWMFFYESFGTVGMPSHLLEIFQEWFQSFYGPSFSSMGFIPNPYANDQIPLGLVESTQRMGEMKTHAFTCAGCHFGQLPDGRYAVGYPNLQLDYGRFIASMVALIRLGMRPEDSGVHPVLRRDLSPAVHEARERSGFYTAMAGLGMNFLTRGGDVLTEGGINLSLEEQLRFWRLRTGTMDFLTKPMVEDGVWTVSRILGLWNMPTQEQIDDTEMPHALLSWTGIGESLMSFLHGFVVVSGSHDHWSDEELKPLADYIYSLRAPKPVVASDIEAVARGATLFAETGCVACHDGPSGESQALYPFETIGTDAALRDIYRPNEEGKLCCGLDVNGERATGMIKSPRLAGQRYRTRLLHNGALDSLEQLLCVTARPMDTLEAAKSTKGHRFGCDELTATEKDDLIHYLEHL